MKINQTEAKAIASQIRDEQKEEIILLEKQHFNSQKVKAETNRLYEKVAPILRHKKLHISYAGHYNSFTTKEQLQRYISNETFNKPRIKEHSIITNEVIIAAISCNNVEQIKKKIKATY